MNGVAFHKALRAVLCRTDITHLDKLVFVALLDVSSDSGVAWPTTETLASMLGVNTRSVRRCLGSLLGHGIIETDARSGGKKSTRYVIVNPDPVAGLGDFQPGQKVRATRPEMVSNPANLSGNPATLAPDRLNTDLDRLKTEEENHFPSSLRGDPSDDVPDEIEASLHALHPRGPSGVSGLWRTKARNHADEYGADRVVEALQWAKAKGRSFADALARVRQQTWDAAKKSDPEELPEYELSEEAKATLRERGHDA